MNLEMKENVESALHKMAADDGLDPVAFVTNLIMAEARRRYWIENSKPRERRPVGRPSLTPEQKQVRELATRLRAFYARRKQFLGNDSLDKAIEELEAAITNEELEKLLQLERTKAWLNSPTNTRTL